MESKKQHCQNCAKEFVLLPKDLELIAKLDVPVSSFCTECKLQRRMMFRNERILYKRPNNAPGKENEQIVSIHRPDTKLTVYDDRTWWGDSWDPIDYGKPYDFSRSFFEQFNDLYKNIPLINLSITNMVDCSYCNVAEGDKGCFMTTASNANEDCLYGNRLSKNKQSLDLYIGTKNELCYELISCANNFKTHFSLYSNECADSYFLYNCKSCVDCIGCVNLRNKSYCIFNEQYSREEYFAKKEALHLESRSGVIYVDKMFKEILKKSIHKYAHNLKALDSTGDNLEHVNAVENSFDVYDAQDCKNAVWGGYGMRDSYDVGPGVGISSELLYDAFDTALNNSRVLFTGVVYHSFDVRYAINCHSSSHLFGCHGLRHKEYCILNKQYTKEEYEALVPKIIQHMQDMPYVDAKGRVFSYGDFFPYDISPFDYNETVAQDYFPLTRDEALQKGFSWHTSEEKKHIPTLATEAIPDSILSVSDSILHEVLSCKNKGNEKKNCTGAFKIFPRELLMYKKLGVPLPVYCPNCRQYNRLQLRNPMKLWRRTCMCDKKDHGHGDTCTKQFETSYNPNTSEIVYCEQCYQIEVF